MFSQLSFCVHYYAVNQMLFAHKKKAYIFVVMIVKSALFFLSVVDLFLDSYEGILQWASKVNEKKAISTSMVEQPKPSYLIQ